MASTLTTEQLRQTWAGLQATLKDVPIDWITTDDIDGLSDDALQSRIDSQQAQIDNNAGMGFFGRLKANLTGDYNPLGDDDIALEDLPAGSRPHAIQTLKAPVMDDATNVAYFHALLGAYSAGQEYTIPDLAFDGVITDGERAAAEEIARRMEAGQMGPQIEGVFNSRATEMQRTEEERLAREAEAAREQTTLETNVDAHLAIAGYIEPDQIGTLTDNQRAIAFQTFLKDQGTSEYMRNGTPDQLERYKSEVIAREQTAIDQETIKVTPDALDMISSYTEARVTADALKTWVESGDPNQIKMADVATGQDADGVLDTETYSRALETIQDGYPTSLNRVDFIRNNTGNINPSLLDKAANEGAVYVPTIDELRAAGISEADLESIEAALPASELAEARAALEGRDKSTFTAEERNIWTADTQEELIARQLLQDPSLYSQIMETRNDMLAETRLAADPVVPDGKAIEGTYARDFTDDEIRADMIDLARFANDTVMEKMPAFSSDPALMDHYVQSINELKAAEESGDPEAMKAAATNVLERVDADLTGLQLREISGNTRFIDYVADLYPSVGDDPEAVLAKLREPGVINDFLQERMVGFGGYNANDRVTMQKIGQIEGTRVAALRIDEAINPNTAAPETPDSAPTEIPTETPGVDGELLTSTVETGAAEKTSRLWSGTSDRIDLGDDAPNVEGPGYNEDYGLNPNGTPSVGMFTVTDTPTNMGTGALTSRFGVDFTPQEISTDLAESLKEQRRILENIGTPSPTGMQ